MPPFISLLGRRFERLVVVERASTVSNRTRWVCRCDCGSLVNVRADHLRDGHCLSCGCYQVERAKDGAIHGMSESPEYAAWKHAKNRCYNPADKKFALYGGRGIRMCEEWRHDFQAFLAEVGLRPTGKTLDRINTNGHYEPGNVRWATIYEQNNNTRRNRAAGRDATDSGAGCGH